MIEIYFPILDVVAVNRLSGGVFPLDLAFTPKNLSTPLRDALAGPGLYLFSYESEVIYAGKYQPLGNGSILDHRWLRHLETITVRGRRVGFGGQGNPARRLRNILSQTKNVELRQSLETVFRDYQAERFRDTGVVTSINRVGFASEKWGFFRDQHDESILVNFEIRLLRVAGLKNQMQASAVVSDIEKRLISEVKPRCNREFSLTQHDDTRKNNRTPEVLKKLSAVTIEVTGSGLSQCVVLGSETDL